jgi:hypothetical protein
MFDGLLGNASEVNSKSLQDELGAILVEGETIEKGFKIIRDLFVFTNKRLILVDRQGFSGKKVEYHSIPYKSITQFSVETAGNWDRDAELRVWLSGKSEPVQRELKKGIDILDLQRTLAKYILK